MTSPPLGDNLLLVFEESTILIVSKGRKDDVDVIRAFEADVTRDDNNTGCDVTCSDVIFCGVTDSDVTGGNEEVDVRVERGRERKLCRLCESSPASTLLPEV